MFFYSSLFIASFINAMIVVWLYKALVGAGKAIYLAILPSSKSSDAYYDKESPLPLTVNNARTPWGWRRNAAVAAVVATATDLPEEKALEVRTVPWGWRGNKHKVGECREKEGVLPRSMADARSHAHVRPSKAAGNPAKKIGWPDRDDQFEFAGDIYRVTQKVNLRKTNLENATTPWGW